MEGAPSAAAEHLESGGGGEQDEGVPAEELLSGYLERASAISLWPLLSAMLRAVDPGG